MEPVSGATGEESLLAHTQDKVALVDENGRFVYVNEAAERILGHDPEALVGQDAFALVHPDDRAAVREGFARVVAAEEDRTVTERYRYRTAGGDYRWLESRVSSETSDDVDGLVVSSRDVTGQVSAERDRAATERRLEELAASVTDVLWMFDADMEELLFVNDAYEDVYGGDLAAVRADARSFLSVVHPDDRERVRTAMARLSAGEPVDLEYRVDPATDHGTWVWVRGNPVREDGEVVRVVGFSRDVTDRRRRERQLTVMDTLLRHNLRNAMAVVVGNADQLAGDTVPPNSERAVAIREAAGELVVTADKQREVIELLQGPAEPTSVDVAAAVEAAAGRVASAHPGAAVETTLPAGVTARAVPKLERAVAELVENALEHHPDDGTTPWASVRVEDGPDGVVVAVSDRCPPLPAAEEGVLTGGERMDAVNHSSGVGLWLVYWMATLSGGSVCCERGPDGNVVRLTLPAGA
jgi:PAS domain S-box-containing protein